MSTVLNLLGVIAVVILLTTVYYDQPGKVSQPKDVVFVVEGMRNKKKRKRAPRTGGVGAMSTGIRTNVTFYASTGQPGASGILVDAYPLKYNGMTLYPVAVHENDYNAWSCKILKITIPSTNRTMYGHVVDFCSDSDCGGCCSTNRAANGYNFLVDIHQVGWAAAGIADGIIPAYVTTVGSLPVQNLPAQYKPGYIRCCGREDWKLNGNGCA
jgi:hypothetical protein